MVHQRREMTTGSSPLPGMCRGEPYYLKGNGASESQVSVKAEGIEEDSEIYSTAC